mgnify:CR=1 FL=1
MNSFNERITIDPNICNGKPTFKGKRIAVQTVLDFLAAGDSIDDILTAYPSLEEADIKAVLELASKMMGTHFTVKSVA